MHTLSTRALFALAFDRGEEYDPGQPLSAELLADLDLTARASAITTDVSALERRRRREHARRQALAAVPDWFSVEDLISAPWEALHGEPV